MLLIPFRTDRPRLRPAYLTVTLIAVNTSIHVLSMLLPDVTVPVRMGGMLLPVEMPQLIAQYGLQGDRPTFLTFFSHMFLHGDWLHLAGNMLFLWVFGSLIEDALRPVGFALVYLAGGIMAAITDILVSEAMGMQSERMVGASGAVSAIMGLFLLRFYHTRVNVFYWLFWFLRGTFWVRSVWMLAYYLVFDIIDGLTSDRTSGVAHWAHVGGFVAGAIAAPFLGTISAARREYVTDDPATNVEQLRFAEEAAQAERELRADPTNAYRMRRLAQAYRRAGEYQLATQTFQRCITSFANRNLLEQAADTYLELMDYHESPALAPEVLVKVARQLERPRPLFAAAAYRTVVDRHPSAPDAEFALLRMAALAIQKLDRPAEGARYLDQFLERYPDSRWATEAREVREKVARRLA